VNVFSTLLDAQDFPIPLGSVINSLFFAATSVVLVANAENIQFISCDGERILFFVLSFVLGRIN
jgi:hypothetical protein